MPNYDSLQFYDQMTQTNRDLFFNWFLKIDSFHHFAFQQFVNGIRKADGVNTFKMDHDEGIEISCEVGNIMKPDISKNILGYDRYLFCDGKPISHFYD